MQNFQTPNPGQTEQYQVPSNQQIILKGTSCFESVSVPGLQNYYANMQMVGREYGYFQLSHFDFPLNDSLTKIFGADYIEIRFRVYVYLSLDKEDITSPEKWIVTDYDTLFRIPVRRVHSIGDIADHLNNAMSMLDLHQENWNHRWKFFLHSIAWDSSLQKIVFQLKIPNHEYYWTTEEDVRYIPMRMTFFIHGNYNPQQAKLAAALFGGKSAFDETLPVPGANWCSEWDTGPTYWLRLATEYPGYDEVNKDLHEMAQNFNISSQRPPRMFVDPYVYIRGAPAQSIWESDGTANNLISVQPRNRPAGVITNEQAYLSNQTHITKTALQSLRAMFLQFTDSDGNVLQIDEEYVVKLSIQFQQ